MGNQQIIDSNQKEESLIASFLKDRALRSVMLIDQDTHDDAIFYPEKRWRAQLLRSLDRHQSKIQDNDICLGIREVISNIEEISFIKAVTVLSSLSASSAAAINKPQIKQEGTILFSEIECPSSSHYSISAFPQNSCHSKHGCSETDSMSTSTASSPSSSPEKGFIQNGLSSKRNLPFILSRQINKEDHPIQQIKQSFLLLLKMKYRLRIDGVSSKREYNVQKMVSEINNDIEFYSSFITDGCKIYKPWILKQSGIRESRYNQYIKSIILESLFEGQSFSDLLYPIIKEIGSTDLVRLFQKLPDHIPISKFSIRPELAIEGMFVNSLMLFSDFDRIASPSKCLQYLQRLKVEICFDIDQYHRALSTQHSFQLDSDNMLGILCFLICRMKPKISCIYGQINVLNSIIGDDMCHNFGAGLYMLTSLNAAFQFLRTQFLGEL